MMMTTTGMMMMIFQVFSYLSYLVESTVSGDLRQVQAIERKSYAHGYGSDAGGDRLIKLERARPIETDRYTPVFPNLMSP